MNNDNHLEEFVDTRGEEHHDNVQQNHGKLRRLIDMSQHAIKKRNIITNKQKKQKKQKKPSTHTIVSDE